MATDKAHEQIGPNGANHQNKNIISTVKKKKRAPVIIFFFFYTLCNLHRIRGQQMSKLPFHSAEPISRKLEGRSNSHCIFIYRYIVSLLRVARPCRDPCRSALKMSRTSVRIVNATPTKSLLVKGPLLLKEECRPCCWCIDAPLAYGFSNVPFNRVVSILLVRFEDADILTSRRVVCELRISACTERSRRSIKFGRSKSDRVCLRSSTS